MKQPTVRKPFARSSKRMPPQPMRNCILCGTDYSREADLATMVAAAIAKPLGRKLAICHSVDHKSKTAFPSELSEALFTFARSQLAFNAGALRNSGIQAVEEFQQGDPCEALLGSAANLQASLVIVGSSGCGQRTNAERGLGRMAERISEASTVPVLLTRKVEPLLDWANGKRFLRVIVELSRATPCIMGQLEWLKRIGRCELILVKLVTESLLQSAESEETEQGLPGFEDHLLKFARDEKADLIIVGQRRRCLESQERVAYLSILRSAQTNVACVPVG